MYLYVIRDLTALKDSNVFEATNDGVALRQYVRLVQDSDFGDEFELYKLGWHDEDECVIVSDKKAVRVTVGIVEPEEEVLSMEVPGE